MQHRPRKRFGQHFLQDNDIIDRIITTIAPQASQHFVEIGPGLGALTCKLLPLLQQLEVIEIDYDLANRLRKLNESKLKIYTEDVLHFDFRQLNQAPLRIVGNLPYNISTPLIFHLLNYTEIIGDMHFMLQKEVVERITATPNSKAYGRLTVMLQYYCTATYLFDVPATAFTPPPKVQSAILQLTPRAHHSMTAIDQTVFATVVKTAFAHPRKMLSNNLENLISKAQLNQLSIVAGQRPQQLSIKQYVTIANYLAEPH